MVIQVLGINFKTAPLRIREQLAVHLEKNRESFKVFLSASDVKASVLLSTCHRIEIYWQGGESPLLSFRKLSRLSTEDFEIMHYHYRQDKAVKHLMQLATGLDSLVLGEPEILGQIKTAYLYARESATLNKVLDRLFQTSFSVAKKARSESGLGLSPLSIAGVSLKLAEKIFGNLEDRTLLLIGAGDLMQKLAKTLCHAGLKKLWIANRTPLHAERLAADCGFEAEAVPLSSMGDCLQKVDCVMAGSFTELPLIGKGMVESAMSYRKQRPLLMIDLGLPRNIETEVKLLNSVYLYHLEDLQEIVSDNLEDRKIRALKAEEIIDEAVEQFMRWCCSQPSLRTLRAFRGHFLEFKENLLREAYAKLDQGQDPKKVLETFAHALGNRWLHKPTLKLREEAASDNQAFLSLIQHLYELPYESLDTN